ncbi:hypothetical protein F0365_09605 [Nonlabens sp. Ci31]|nr:hypothetical protein F0365_09605 [Nonlabens sp. Ci31]
MVASFCPSRKSGSRCFPEDGKQFQICLESVMDGDNFDHREHLLDAEQICMLYSSPFLEIPRTNFPAGQIYFTSANLRDSCPSSRTNLVHKR